LILWKGDSIAFHDFNSKDACEAALTAYLHVTSGSLTSKVSVGGLCEPKG
jgi:hypothetical protein